MISKYKVSVLFVCLGNICRSPTAHGVFQSVVDESALGHMIGVDSAGTSDFHIGSSPDPRSVAAAHTRGYDLSELQARQVQIEDYKTFDYILAMDDSNLSHLRRDCPSDFDGRLGLFLDFAGFDEREVPDPYYGGSDGFSHVLDLVESASEGLLCQIEREIEG